MADRTDAFDGDFDRDRCFCCMGAAVGEGIWAMVGDGMFRFEAMLGLMPWFMLVLMLIFGRAFPLAFIFGL